MNKKYLLGGGALAALYFMSQKPKPKPRNNYLTLTVPKEVLPERTTQDGNSGGGGGALSPMGNWRNNL